LACGALPWQWASCAAGVAKSVAGDAFEAIAQSFGQAAADATTWLWGQMDQATAVSLGGAGFSTVLGMVAAIAGTVAVALFVLQVAQSVLRRDPGGLARAVKGLFIAFLAGGAAVVVVNALLAATDALCNGITESAVGTDQAGLGRLVLGSTATAGVVGTVGGASAAAGVLLLALAILAAVVIVYSALVVRKVLIVMTAVFAPLAFAGSLADVTVAWTRRWVEVTLALIFSKVVLVLIFVLGYFMLVGGAGQAAPGVTEDVTQVVSGVLVVALAGFSPWVALKIVHFTGEHAQQLHVMASTAATGPVVAARMAQKAGPLTQTAAPLARRAGSALPAGLDPQAEQAPDQPTSGGRSVGAQPPSPPPGGGGHAPPGVTDTAPGPSETLPGAAPPVLHGSADRTSPVPQIGAPVGSEAAATGPVAPGTAAVTAV
jgi:type IV secretion system protein TrbL